MNRDASRRKKVDLDLLKWNEGGKIIVEVKMVKRNVADRKKDRQTDRQTEDVLLLTLAHLRP